MTKQGLERVAERYLEDLKPEARSLQRRINAEFVALYASDTRLLQFGSQWARSQLGAFTAGFISASNKSETKRITLLAPESS